MLPMSEWRVGLSSICLHTECEACAHARDCEQLLLSSITISVEALPILCVSDYCE